jgi:anion-transporting  ArsA/GET3 family ATPase
VARNLNKFGIRVRGVVINHVLTAEAANSGFNKSRREMQLKYVDEIERTYSPTMPVVQLPLQAFEVKGVEALKKVERLLFP